MLVFRDRAAPQFLLVHPGGPYWRGKDIAAWSFPKGLIEPGEAPQAAARREFAEETGLDPPQPIAALEPCRQPGGKLVLAWLAEADLDLSGLRSNSFELEWPPRSGRIARFPEIDQAAYVPAAVAMEKIHRGLVPLLVEALALLGVSAPTRPEPRDA